MTEKGLVQTPLAGLTEKAWTKAYTAVGSVSVVFAWTAASSSRGISVKDESVTNLSALGPVFSALFSFLWLWGLCMVMLILSYRYMLAVDRKRTCWSERMPLAFFDHDDVIRGSSNGQWFQAITAIGFILVPFICLLVVFITFMSTDFYARGGEVKVNGWAQLFSPRWWPGTFTDGYRFGHPTKGLTYFPLLQPSLYLLLTLVHLFFLFKFVFGLFAKSPKGGEF